MRFLTLFILCDMADNKLIFIENIFLSIYQWVSPKIIATLSSAQLKVDAHDVKRFVIVLKDEGVI
jgi:hypothetical protein